MNPTGGSAQAVKPFILAVDHDQASRRLLRRELTGRYGDDYSIDVQGAAAGAAVLLRRMAAAGDELALILADPEPAEHIGAPLLSTAPQLHPRARRAVPL